MEAHSLHPDSRSLKPRDGGWGKRKTAPKNVRHQALDVQSKDEFDDFLDSDRSNRTVNTEA
jgi:hypothetical protein